MLEQMIGAYLIALVRRIRNAMDEIKKFLHRSAQIFYDMRADEIRKRQRQLPPRLDEQLILRIERIVIRHRLGPM